MSENMELMVAYTTNMLSALSTWLLQEPMIYFVGMLVGVFVINIVFSIFNLGRRRN